MQIDFGHEAVLFLSVEATGLPSVTFQIGFETLKLAFFDMLVWLLTQLTWNK